MKTMLTIAVVTGLLTQQKSGATAGASDAHVLAAGAKLSDLVALNAKAGEYAVASS